MSIENILGQIFDKPSPEERDRRLRTYAEALLDLGNAHRELFVDYLVGIIHLESAMRSICEKDIPMPRSLFQAGDKERTALRALKTVDPEAAKAMLEILVPASTLLRGEDDWKKEQLDSIFGEAQ